MNAAKAEELLELATKAADCFFEASELCQNLVDLPAGREYFEDREQLGEEINDELGEALAAAKKVAKKVGR